MTSQPATEMWILLAALAWQVYDMSDLPAPMSAVGVAFAVGAGGTAASMLR